MGLDQEDEDEIDITEEPWTACEECAHMCGGGDDYMECGLDLGDPFGGGVTFVCDRFEQRTDNLGPVEGSEA